MLDVIILINMPLKFQLVYLDNISDIMQYTINEKKIQLSHPIRKLTKM